MVFERLPTEMVDPAILGEEVHFRSGKTAKNRFLKVVQKSFSESFMSLGVYD